MGIPIGGKYDLATPILSTEAAPVYGGETPPNQTWKQVALNFGGANSAAFQGCTGPFSVAAWGSFVGTVTLQKTYDNGTTWISTGITWTSPGAIALIEAELGAQYRINATTLTSGSIQFRFSGSNALYFTSNPKQ